MLHVLFFVFVSFVHFLSRWKTPADGQGHFVEVPAAPPPTRTEPQARLCARLNGCNRSRSNGNRFSLRRNRPTFSTGGDAQGRPGAAAPTAPPQPMKRRLLQDNRATDTLQARNLTKTASRKTTTKTTTKVAEAPSMFVPGFSTVAALRGAADRRHVVRSSLPPTAPGRGRRTLQASASGEAQTATSVGVLRRINPLYPLIAKKSGWEGTVLIRVTLRRTAGPVRSSCHGAADVKFWITPRSKPSEDGRSALHGTATFPFVAKWSFLSSFL